MKTPRIVSLVIVSTCFIATAQAYFDPTIGRWANRDPIGEPGFEVIREAPLRTNSERSRDVPSSDYLIRLRMKSLQVQSDTPIQIQYPEWLNLYQFVDNDPINEVDADGLRKKRRVMRTRKYGCLLLKDEKHCPPWTLINHKCTYICQNNFDEADIRIFEHETVFKCPEKKLILDPYWVEE